MRPKYFFFRAQSQLNGLDYQGSALKVIFNCFVDFQSLLSTLHFPILSFKENVETNEKGVCQMSSHRSLFIAEGNTCRDFEHLECWKWPLGTPYFPNFFSGACKHEPLSRLGPSQVDIYIDVLSILTSQYIQNFRWQPNFIHI